MSYGGLRVSVIMYIFVTGKQAKAIEMISVIIPLYNKGELVARALDSILAQDFVDYEVIVVDDGSTDGSVEVVSRYFPLLPDGRLRVVSQRNAGVGAARNRGIAEAKGAFVTFLDADDEWRPGHLAALVALASRYPQCEVIATNYDNLTADGRILPNRLQNVPFDGVAGLIDNYFVMAACSNPPLWTSAVMVSTEAMRRVGGFPQGIKSGEDLLTWARLAAVCQIAYCMEPSAVYHRGSSNPRPPERVDEVGRQLELLYGANCDIPGLKRYVALWYNMRMSRCLAHRMYGRAFRALCRSLRYRPTLRIAKPLVQFTLLGLRHKQG